MTYVKYGDEWKKETMKNSKEDITNMLKRVALERDANSDTVRKLTEFVNAFLDNFKNCELCNGSGWDEAQTDNCTCCHGSGEQIDSIGTLFIDMPEKARAILAKVKHV